MLIYFTSDNFYFYIFVDMKIWAIIELKCNMSTTNSSSITAAGLPQIKDLATVSISNTSATLNWTFPQYRGDDVTTFKVHSIIYLSSP